MLSIAEKVPMDMPIVPVYVRVKTSSLGIHYHIVECSIPDTRFGTVDYNELVVKN